MQIVLACVVAAQAAAREPAVLLHKAEALVESLDYVEAREVLQELVADPKATHEQLVAGHMLAGEVDRVLERDVDARMHFYWVLSRNPEATLPPDKPPKVTAFFALVRDEVRATRVAAPSVGPVEPAPPPPPKSALPLVVTGGGALVLVAGGIGAAVFELQYGNTANGYGDRQQAQVLGIASWIVAAVGAIGAGAGALWWLMEDG